MQFANPIWLWALSGLAIPIGIHLLSRKEGKVIYIGSLRHLDESNTKQFRALKLNEVLLLAIRCILIIVTVLLLAGLQILNTPAASSKWLVIEPGIQKDARLNSLTDSLTEAGYETHFMSLDFPAKEDTTAVNTANYWALIEQLKTKGLQDIVVLSHSHLKDFTGARIPLPATLKWITVDANPGQSIVLAQRYTSDSAMIRLAKSDGSQMRYTYQQTAITPEQRTVTAEGATAQLGSTDTLHVIIAYDKTFQFDANIMAASLKAIQKIPAAPIAIHITPVENFKYTSMDWLVWLSEKKMTYKDACHTITYKNNAASTNILLQEGSQSPFQQWLLTARLTIDVALQHHLTTRLASIMLNNSETIAIATKADERILPEEFLSASSEQYTPVLKRAAVTTPLDKYLIILLAFMVLTERLLAYHRNQ
jgi:hypothetical protein